MKVIPRSLSLFLALTIALSLSVPFGVAQVCPNRQCSLQNISDADALLNLTHVEKADAEARHVLSGRPIAPADASNEHMIHQHEWITWYDDDLRVPLWVAYELTKADASAQLTRKNCFRKDPRLSDEVASV